MKIKDLKESISKVSTTDELTGLHNRKYLHERLDAEISRAKRYGNKVSCLLLDIDFFKVINDMYGYDWGDVLLKRIADMLRRQNTSHPQKDRSFHYLPYHTDSRFEQMFMEEVLIFAEFESLGLEIYYNGDRALTEFKIKCYKRTGAKWTYIGMYTPDFLIIRRKDGMIHKAIIVETKGEGFEPKFADKKTFMESAFLQKNNEKFGYARFDFLYLPDTLTDSERMNTTHEKICAFFGEG